MLKRSKKLVAPAVGDIVRGVVSETIAEQSAGRLIALVQLMPWIDAAGSTRRRALQVSLPLASRESLMAAAHWSAAWLGRSVALTVTQVSAPTRDRPGGVETDELRPTTLDDALTRTRDLVVVEDGVLGALLLDVELRALIGRRMTARLDYEVMIDAPPGSTLAAATTRVERARPDIVAIERSLPALREACADELFAAYDDQRAPSSPPVTRTAFKRALQLAAIHVHGRRITVYLAAEALFPDRVVEVRLASNLEVNEVLVS